MKNSADTFCGNKNYLARRKVDFDTAIISLSVVLYIFIHHSLENRVYLPI